MKYVLLYTPAADVAETAPVHFPAHSDQISRFHAAGDILMVGPFTDMSQGSMAVFPTREAAEKFVAEDPFVRYGVVAAHEIREWDEVLA